MERQAPKVRKLAVKARNFRISSESTADEASREDAPNPGANTGQAAGSKSFPSKTMSTVPKRWESQDLDLLKSGLFADADIVTSELSAPPRKVHRNILAGRSDWFKKAFSGDHKERIEGKVFLPETAWQIDLILYFFYSGGIDMADNALTGGRNVMDISIELLRLGDRFGSKSMQDYGKELLATYLCELLDHFCDASASLLQKKVRFNNQAGFPTLFCAAVRDAFCTQQPIEPAQRILADFAFAARAHLFGNKEFVGFIESKAVPEFGNLVLTAQMKGSVSDAFKLSNTFKKYQDWRVNP